MADFQQTLQAMDEQAFVQHLGGIYEHSPWVAQRAWQSAPFADRDTLMRVMADVVWQASRDEQLTLIRAHPELTGKAGVREGLTAESNREQLGAGLDACSPEEYEALHLLNARYRERFGFPFIVAVTGLQRADIIAQLAARVENTPEVEFTTALTQIERIAGIRLAQLLPGA